MGVRRRTPSVLTALYSALRAKPPADADAAAVALAKRYALELDDAAALSKALKKTFRKLLESDIDGALYDELMDLALRIEGVSVAALIGPKLLDALGALEMTPKSRTGILQGGGAQDDDGDPGRSTLDELRDRRKNRAKTVDASS